MKKINIAIKKNIIKNIFLNQKGMALLTTLIFVFILVTLGVALLTMTSNDSKMSTLQRASTKAFYNTDAGIEQVLYNLNTPESGYGLDFRWDSEDPLKGVFSSSEYYEVTVENIGIEDPSATPPTYATDKIKIISTGYVKDAKFSSGKRTIEVIAEIFFTFDAKYKYAILGDKLILLHGGTTSVCEIEGNIHSNDSIENPGSKFAEDYDYSATAGGERNDVDSSATFAGHRNLPTIQYSELHDLAFAADQVYSQNEIDDLLKQIKQEGGTWGTEDDPITGIHYIQGDLIVPEGLEVYIKDGAIIAEGDIEFKNDSSITHDRSPGYFKEDDYKTGLALVAQGDIDLKAKSTTLYGVVQSILPNGESIGEIHFRNQALVNGSVIAREVILCANAKVIYDEDALNKITTQGDGLYKKTSWREVY